MFVQRRFEESRVCEDREGGGGTFFSLFPWSLNIMQVVVKSKINIDFSKL